MRVVGSALLITTLLLSQMACDRIYVRGENPGYHYEVATSGPGLKIPPTVDALPLNSRYDIPPVSARSGSMDIEPPDFHLEH
ncbi:MAG: hypothetical protein V4490_00775 [Pseudomonadota bacterium]